MGMIHCLADGANGLLTFTSISGTNPSNTWARFKNATFTIAGGGTFALELTTPFSNFRFNPSASIDWGTGGQPSFIQIQTSPAATPTALTLLADSSQAATKTFTVLNTTSGGESIVITITSAGGSGGAGGTIPS